MPQLLIGLLAVAAPMVLFTLLLQWVKSMLEKRGALEFPATLAIFVLHLLIYLTGAVILIASSDLVKAINPQSLYSYGIVVFALLPAGFVKRNAIITKTQMVFTSERISSRSEYGQYAQFRRLTAGQDKELQQANEELAQWEKRLEKLHNEKTIEDVKQKIEALKQRIELLKGHMTDAADEPSALSSAVLAINRLETRFILQCVFCALLFLLPYAANMLIYRSSRNLIFLLAIYAFACADAILFSISIRELLFKWRMPKEAFTRTLFVFASYIISAAVFLGAASILTGSLT